MLRHCQGHSSQLQKNERHENTHQSELIRPFKLHELIAKFKDAGNRFYKNVLQKCLFCNKEFKENEPSIYDHVKKCHMDFVAKGNNLIQYDLIFHFSSKVGFNIFCT